MTDRENHATGSRAAIAQKLATEAAEDALTAYEREHGEFDYGEYLRKLSDLTDELRPAFEKAIEGLAADD